MLRNVKTVQKSVHLKRKSCFHLSYQVPIFSPQKKFNITSFLCVAPEGYRYGYERYICTYISFFFFYISFFLSSAKHLWHLLFITQQYILEIIPYHDMFYSHLTF